MFLELIATFFAGIAAAGVFFLANKLLGGRLSKGLMPVAAGGAMIAVTIANEYGWYPRTKAILPEGIEVAQVIEAQMFYRPWTYVKPYVSRFVAVDQKTIRTHPNQPDQRIAELLFYGRWAPLHRVQVLVDCRDGRRAELIDGVDFAPDGAVLGADWSDTGLDDPVTMAACKGG